MGQFIKLASLVEPPGQAKDVFSAGRVEVNRQVETHRGTCLWHHDVGLVHPWCVRVLKEERLRATNAAKPQINASYYHAFSQEK
ncbi:RNA-binding S4 domain-containing protein [Corynebacterium parakroppenstedtii]|uniref:RNA-binding S4 domain-containing protein n=1 Tax=Corynebacterium parakroppenstedtii TaxID=2828363 RepID=UPI001C8E68C5|nr:RNA-binding S4 domain-containing protein [Corynebacterium parakroppenstedtii]MBY0794354.1 RNA-binding S4 domain-containing protein [Corynebacterium parakroppenstedtii]MBY0796994.1 RNA-binding S4 domain-containing protein [Corynebacterium parakroppenstedtii]